LLGYDCIWVFMHHHIEAEINEGANEGS